MQRSASWLVKISTFFGKNVKKGELLKTVLEGQERRAVVYQKTHVCSPLVLAIPGGNRKNTVDNDVMDA